MSACRQSFSTGRARSRRRLAPKAPVTLGAPPPAACSPHSSIRIAVTHAGDDLSKQRAREAQLSLIRKEGFLPDQTPGRRGRLQQLRPEQGQAKSCLDWREYAHQEAFCELCAPAARCQHRRQRIGAQRWWRGRARQRQQRRVYCARQRPALARRALRCQDAARRTRGLR